MSECCGEGFNVVKTRTVLIGVIKSKSHSLFTTPLHSDDNIVSYKALAQRAGVSRGYSVKAGIWETHSPIGQLAGAATSITAPGDLGPLRSPIRSTAFRTITPGKPNIPVNLPGSVKPNAVRNRTYRCPEGYQFGGRFTDNRLSTCGAQLFDIPSALGLAIGVARRLARGARAATSQANVTPIAGGTGGESVIQSRKPVIPRVSIANPKLATQEASKLVSALGGVEAPTVRMVRRDGFVLEPVVSAQVLRAIPDNRDMEGAHYLMSVQSVDQLGGQELGLLSNTGVTKLSYVLPGGSSLSLEKKRPLTVGERRKLGRTVNTASNVSVQDNPVARLQEVVNQTGDGIGYTESFVNISNPNEMVSKPGKKPVIKWVDVAFGKGKKATSVSETRSGNDVSSEIGKKISNVDDAISHLNKNGSIAEIDPLILQQVLAEAAIIKSQKLDAKRTFITLPNGDKYTVYSQAKPFEHIGQKFASDVQQHLGLESPDVFFVGQGDARKYAVQDPSTALRGFKVDNSKVFKDFSPADVARIIVSDILTDQRDRGPGSIVPMSDGNTARPVLVNNFTSGLVALDKIDITNRMNMKIDDLFSADRTSQYRQYWAQLRENQRFSFKKEIDSLLKKARSFNFTNFKTRLYNDGHLSDAEKAHLEIVNKILEQRITLLTNSKDILVRVLENKQ